MIVNNPTNEELATELNDKVGKLLKDAGVEQCILLYELPDDTAGSYRSFRRGHFYDTLKIVGAYIQQARERVSKDLSGIA